jgi:hypothetical protein
MFVDPDAKWYWEYSDYENTQQETETIHWEYSRIHSTCNGMENKMSQKMCVRNLIPEFEKSRI